LITRFASVFLAFAVLACGGSRPEDDGIDPGKADLLDALTLFVEAVQAERFDKAMAMLTPEERSRMVEAGGEPSPDIKRRLKALRLSTLAQGPAVRLLAGKVSGIYEQLPDLGPLPGGGHVQERGPEVPTFQ
jgi:hypothetical protein